MGCGEVVLFSHGVALVLAMLLVPLAGCGTAARVVRLDTGQGKPLVHTPRNGEASVELRQGEFKEALAELARDVRPASNPLRHARRLMVDSPWQEAVYLKWTGRRLILDSEAAEAVQAAQASHALTCDYGRWCERTGRSRDCLSLLKDGPVLNADGRYALAMELAMGSVWNETLDAFKDMADPEAVRATVVSAMALYMTLWVLSGTGVEGDCRHADRRPHRLPGRGHRVESHARLDATGGRGGSRHHLRRASRGR
jgi:hypothetical protein